LNNLQKKGTQWVPGKVQKHGGSGEWQREQGQAPTALHEQGMPSRAIAERLGISVIKKIKADAK
jgi:hypothetical protein